MICHKDETNFSYMHSSRNCHTFKSVSDGKPEVACDSIAGAKGVRDRNIFR